MTVTAQLHRRSPRRRRFCIFLTPLHPRLTVKTKEKSYSTEKRFSADSGLVLGASQLVLALSQLHKSSEADDLVGQKQGGVQVRLGHRCSVIANVFNLVSMLVKHRRTCNDCGRVCC